jgi:hypothetical protein
MNLMVPVLFRSPFSPHAISSLDRIFLYQRIQALVDLFQAHLGTLKIHYTLHALGSQFLNQLSQARFMRRLNLDSRSARRKQPFSPQRRLQRKLGVCESLIDLLHTQHSTLKFSYHLFPIL